MTKSHDQRGSVRTRRLVGHGPIPFVFYDLSATYGPGKFDHPPSPVVPHRSFWTVLVTAYRSRREPPSTSVIPTAIAEVYLIQQCYARAIGYSGQKSG
ncbi:hypothetical protein PAXINDRAFT_172587 [Paxillus involutus ATCC 200175]|uniref:Uncharacterized protein n=1 Tax=Paxillus involutus ATCC 200175 TaxID=664439 RepID=A0A0C9T0K1_PAXIN|nr:hypothetical protein PAXINDRAFT_172587 [Paxillus involutus ATCC 200175]